MKLCKRSFAAILSLCFFWSFLVIPRINAAAEEEEIPLNLVWQFETTAVQDNVYNIKSVENDTYISCRGNLEALENTPETPPAKVYFSRGTDRIVLFENLGSKKAGDILQIGSACSWGRSATYLRYFQDNGDGTYTLTGTVTPGKNYIIANGLATDPETNITTCWAMSNVVTSPGSYSARLVGQQLEVRDNTIYPKKLYPDPTPADDPDWVPGMDKVDERALWEFEEDGTGNWYIKNPQTGKYISRNASSQPELADKSESGVFSITSAGDGFYMKPVSFTSGGGLFYETGTDYPGWTFHSNKTSFMTLFKRNENGHYVKTGKIESGKTYVVGTLVNDELCAALTTVSNGQAGWKSRFSRAPLPIINNAVGKLPWDFDVTEDRLTFVPADPDRFYGGGDLILTSRNLKGTCDLYFTDENGHKLPGTKKLASVEVWTYFKTTIDLHDKLYFPENACYIKGYIDDQEVLSCEIPENKRYSNDRYGEKRYSFGVLADTHVGDGQTNPTTAQKLTNALTYFQNYGCDFVNIAGDVTQNGVNSANGKEIKLYSQIIAPFKDKMPVYAVMGNHDAIRSEDQYEMAVNYWKEYAGTAPYFTKVVGDDVFIYLSVQNWIGYNYSTPLSDEYMNFLETELDKYADKRVFLFFHYPLNNTTTVFKDPFTGVKPNRTVLNPESEQVQWLDKLFAKHDNVIYFNGHIHWNYEMQHLDPDFNICDQNGTIATMVHVNSCGAPGVMSNGVYYDPLPPEASYGNIVDVYDEYVVIRAVDFASGEFITEAQYVIEQRGTREYIKTGDFNLTNDTLSYEYERLPFADEKNADVFVSVYDEQNNLIYCSRNTPSASVTFPQGNAAVVKVFIWENGTMKPLIENPAKKAPSV